MKSAPILLLLMFASLLVPRPQEPRDDSSERELIEKYNNALAHVRGAKLVELDIQKLNYRTSLIPTKDVWRSTAKLDFDGEEKEIAVMFVDFVPGTDPVLPIFEMEDNKKTELLHETTKDFLAKRAAHFLTFEAKLFNEPDGVNDNGLNIRTFKLKNGESFRGHLVSRDGQMVTIEKLPTRSTIELAEFSDADQKWLEAAPAKIAR